MDYNILRRIIASCVTGSTRDPRFRINIPKLRKKVKDLELIPLVYKSEYVSKMVTPDDLPLLMEYFKEDKVMWFDTRKSYLTISFIREQDLDGDMRVLLMDVLEARNRIEDKTYSTTPGSKVVHGPCVKDNETIVEKLERIRKGKEFHYHERDVDIVETLATILGCYPAYTAVVAKWIKPDSISLNIRIRANVTLINATTYDTTDGDDDDDSTGDSESGEGTDGSEDTEGDSSDEGEDGSETDEETGEETSEADEEEDEVGDDGVIDEFEEDSDYDDDDVIEDENY